METLLLVRAPGADVLAEGLRDGLHGRGALQRQVAADHGGAAEGFRVLADDNRLADGAPGGDAGAGDDGDG